MSTIESFIAENLPTGAFVPTPYYEPHTDSLIVYARNEPSSRRPINEFLTIHVADDDGSLVGCEIRGLKGVLRLARFLDLAGVRLDVHDLSVSLLISVALIAKRPEQELSVEVRRALEAFQEYRFDASRIAA